MIDPKIIAHIDACKEEMILHMERRHSSFQLTDEQLEKLTDQAATKALSKLTDLAYREVGRGVVSKFLYLVGVLTVAGYLYAQSHGWVK